MGFDDIIYETELEDKILSNFKENPNLLTKYINNPTDEKLTSWENEKCYCGYSLAYNILYSIRFTLTQGCHPKSIKNTKYEKWCRLKTRETILEMIVEALKDDPMEKDSYDKYMDLFIETMEKIQTMLDENKQ